MPKKTKKETLVENSKPEAVSVAAPTPTLTESQKIWNEIANVQINMFALPDQTIEKYCKPIPIDPNRCFMTIKVSAVLPALEDALKNFNVEMVGKFVVLTRK